MHKIVRNWRRRSPGLPPIDHGSLLSAGTAKQMIERAKSVEGADLLADAFSS
jgi:hypothetical protein